MEMTRENIGFTLDLRDRLLSLQIDFHFVRAVVACSILERTSGFEPLCETTAPRYLSLLSTQLLSLSLNLPLDAIGAGQTTMVYKITIIMWSRRFHSEVNLKPAFVVSDLLVPCHR